MASLDGFGRTGLGRGALSALAIGTAAGCIGLTAHAEGVLEEVIVTAQKREQSIQDVGIAITAFTGAQMRALGVEDSIDIAAMTPGVHLSGNNGGQKTLFTIRGVTQNDFNDHTEAPVAVYVDDGYVAFGQGQLFGAYDLDRVEVLKGPQGTLFGRNATGGLVHYVSNRPSRSLEAYVDTTYGSYDHVRVESAVSGPFSDNVAGRLAVLYQRFDPVIDNDYPNRAVTLDGTPNPSDNAGTLDEDTFGVRGQLQFGADADRSLLLIGNYMRTEQNSAPFLELPTVPIFDAAGNHVGTIRGGADETREAISPDGTPIDHPLSFDGDLTRPAGGNLYGPSCSEHDRRELSCSMDFAWEDVNTTDSYGLTAKLTWPIGGLTLTSVTDLKDFEKFQAITADGGPASTVEALFDAEATTVTQELRLNGETDRLRWVTGAYYLYVDLDSDFSLPAEPNSLFEPLVGVPWEDVARAELETNSASLFGQVEFDLTDTLTLIAGARVIREEKEFTGEETFFLNTAPLSLDTDTVLFNVQPRTSHDVSDTLWSGKLQLDWRPVDDLLLYAGVNRGVKAGGFNAPATFGAGFPASDIPYGEEVLYSYETGFKWDGLFGRTTRLNGSFYYYDYNDYQGFFFTQVTGYVRNLDGEYFGLELELQSSPVEGLDLVLNFAALDAELYDIQLGPGIFKDSRPSFAPKTQASALVRYQFGQDVFGGRVSAQLSGNYASSFYDNIRNFDASLMPSYVLANARLGWQSDDSRWEAQVFVNNMLDRKYYVIGYDLSNATGSNSLVPGKPRWYGVSLRYNFD
jgi:iron complex outermembrane receptor protein